MKGVVLLSGGLDSLATLILAQEECTEVGAIHFTYGQTSYKEERKYAEEICEKLKVPLKVIPLEFLSGVVDTKYTSGKEIEFGEPDIFVPNRNLMFITIAHAYCQTNGYDALYVGLYGDAEFSDLDKPVLKEDRIDSEIIKRRFNEELEVKTFPDSSDYFIRMVDPFIQSQSGTDVAVKFPLFKKTKSYAFEVLDKAGLLEEAKYKSISCYNGSLDKHDWGIGCADCTTCYSKKLSYMVYKHKKANK